MRHSAKERSPQLTVSKVKKIPQAFIFKINFSSSSKTKIYQYLSRFSNQENAEIRWVCLKLGHPQFQTGLLSFLPKQHMAIWRGQYPICQVQTHISYIPLMDINLYRTQLTNIPLGFFRYQTHIYPNNNRYIYIYTIMSTTINHS